MNERSGRSCSPKSIISSATTDRGALRPRCPYRKIRSRSRGSSSSTARTESKSTSARRRTGYPILYHDNSLNLRLIQRGPLLGPAENYTYAQLRASVRLLHGEKIPSLEEFLDVVITETTLKFVYVDCKPTIGPYLATAAAIQKAALLKAQSLGRDVQIYLAITTDDILAGFLALPDHENIPSICELDVDKLHQANSHVWSPRFTEGTQNAEVAALHAEGRVAITWTVNSPTLIEQYIREGSFDGMLSDYPTWVAYYYYRQ